ncbi:MAG: glycosyltransferase family A protein [Pyrinomonadaceae bacterium]
MAGEISKQSCARIETFVDKKQMFDAAPISVIIPAYNSEFFIAEALKSVLQQSVAVAEIIVVDDGSEDQTPKIAESFGVRVIRQSNAGPAAARNAGVSAATPTLDCFSGCGRCMDAGKD